MRVAVDARSFVSRPTGVGRYLEGLLGACLENEPKDTFVLLSPRGAVVPPSLSGRVEVAPPGASLPGTLWLQTVAPVEAARAGADLFFGPLAIVPILSSLPSVATVHDLTPLLFPEWHSWKNRLGFSPLFASSVRRSRRIAAVSEATRRDLVRLFPEAAEKCVVVPNGLTAPPKDAGEAPANGARPYVLFLGTLEPRKNVGRLVAAMESIWDQRPDFPDLVLAGDDGWGVSGLDGRLRSSRHAARIRHQGYASAADAHRLLKNARLLAYPSLYEGFGLPVLEAMAEGVPVVASSRSSLPEVVGDAGLLPDPERVEAIAAALVKAETDAKWRRDARLKGFARAEKFSWARAARAMRGLFEEALA